jgi:16S rRNA (guanine966-N2)-methyltransferase
LRIIAGNLKGKKLFSLKGKHIRPTSDRLRESIFNILSNRLYEAFVLDLFAGTGALGIEAISRGAVFSYFIDNNNEAISIILKNIKSSALESKSRVIKWDIRQNLKCIEHLTHKFNFVFMDPPYNEYLIEPTLENLTRSGALQNNATIVIEHAKHESITTNQNHFTLLDYRKHRDTRLTILIYKV